VSVTMAGGEAISDSTPGGIDVTIVMPCLNEANSLMGCVANARAALERMRLELGFSGEILVADNGSSDGSRELARACGARVVEVARRGYGAALIGGAKAARGRFIVMGDADGSYDFCEAVGMVAALDKGAGLCLGSRFKGEIKPGAMPWKNRHIGNPVLTFILNLLFRAGVSDAHCGLRAVTKPCFEQLGLAGEGMEFASEMIIKATLKGVEIAEVPATLSPDQRQRAPHLRPWRDGWRHLRYLLMLSPTWVFALPAALIGVLSLAILVLSAFDAWVGLGMRAPIGNYWVILAGAMLGVGQVSGLLAAASHLYGVREGYRRPSRWTARLARFVSLETMLIFGLASFLAGFAVLFGVVAYWSSMRFGRIDNVLPAVIGTTLIVLGAQNALGGFLLAILSGNEAEFLKDAAPRAQPTQADVPEGRVANVARR
jgi:glycosyltransferase involved in cell wall biosynthesis